jgi:hypothetical protein
MNSFDILLVFAMVFFALIWHDSSARPEKNHEKPDPAVLFAKKSGDFQKRASPIPVYERENMHERATNESFDEKKAANKDTAFVAAK